MSQPEPELATDVRAALVGAYYPRAVGAADAARGCAQGAYTIAAAVATALVTAGVLGDIARRPLAVQVLGVAALALWMAVAQAALRGVQSKMTEIDRRQRLARVATVVAIAVTLATFVAGVVRAGARRRAGASGALGARSLRCSAGALVPTSKAPSSSRPSSASSCSSASAPGAAARGRSSSDCHGGRSSAWQHRERYRSAVAHETTSARILIAEDETIIRLDLRDLLERSGFDVCAEARDGLEAVELARSERPDLAVLDVKMPRLDGIEAARRILDERPIPIVMLTAYGQEELVSRAVEAGVFGYLVKPFRESDLLPAIRTARARHEELAALRDEVESLAEALAARKSIERAKGLLMEREGLSESDAFARLRRASQVSGRPLRVVAEALLATFESR